MRGRARTTRAVERRGYQLTRASTLINYNITDTAFYIALIETLLPRPYDSITLPARPEPDAVTRHSE